MSGTTIRVKVKTRDQLLSLAAQQLGGGSHDDAIQFLLDEHWRSQCIEQADRMREENPRGWRAELAASNVMDQKWTPEVAA